MLFALLSLLSQPVHAWTHTQTVWDRRLFDEPGEGLEWWVADGLEDSLEEGYEIDVLQYGFDHWTNEAPCAELATTFMGRYEGHNAGYTPEGKNVFYWDDPIDEVGIGVLGQTRCSPSGTVAFSLAGETYVYAMDCDIIYNKDIDWDTLEGIENGCTQEFAIEAVATHEIGHLWGMGHSCEEGEECTDLDERYATMYWSIGPCSTYQAELKIDDIEGITALYGPYASFSSNSERDGGVPLEVCFDLEMDGENADVVINWNFGDGTEEVLENPVPGQQTCHTYNESGQWTVSMDVTGSQAECGEWSFTQRERAYVTVCDVPRKADGEGIQGMFTYLEGEDFIYQMVNQVDTTVYGCIEKIQWDVFQGEDQLASISAWSPKINFSTDGIGNGPGEYRVVLNVGAPGALYAAEELIVDVREISGGLFGGCSTVPASGGVLGVIIGLLGLTARRRED